MGNNGLRGAIKKFCNSVWCANGTDKTITLFFNVISLYINTLLTSVKKFFYSNQIEVLGHVVEIRLHGLLPVSYTHLTLPTKRIV